MTNALLSFKDVKQVGWDVFRMRIIVQLYKEIPLPASSSEHQMALAFVK